MAIILMYQSEIIHHLHLSEKIVIDLKGQSNEICYLRLFHRWTRPKPLTRYLKTFQIWLRIRRDIQEFLLTLRYYL
jgi:hypothetical protein